MPGSSGIRAAPGSEAESERSPGGQWEAIPVPRLQRPQGRRGDLRGHEEMVPGAGERILFLVLGEALSCSGSSSTFGRSVPAAESSSGIFALLSVGFFPSIPDIWEDSELRSAARSSKWGRSGQRGGFSSLTPFLSFFSAILAGAFPTGLAFPGACRAQPGEVREAQAGLAGVRGMLPAAPRPEPGGGARWERSPWQPPAPAPSSRSVSGVALYFLAPCFSSSLFLLEEKTL